MYVPFFQRSPLQEGAAAIAPTPVTQSGRIEIIDSLRGVALFGILLMNIPYFALPEIMSYNLNLHNEYSGPNYYTWWVVNMGFEGTMRAIFTMLFGAGSLLLLQRLEKKEGSLSGADIYYRRLIWLLIFGLINAFVFLWPGDILYTYALCGLFLFPFRNLNAKWLLAFGIGFMLIANFKETMRWYEARDMRIKGLAAVALVKKDSTVKLTEDQEAAKKKWEGFVEKNKPENLKKESDKEIREMHKGYFAIMGKLNTLNQRIQSKAFYHNYFYDAMFLLFVGMALFKWGVFTGERSKKFYWILMLVGYGIGLPLSYHLVNSFVQTKFDRTLLIDRILIDFYQEKRFFVAMGHVGVVMLLYKYKVLNVLLTMLARVGQMAFTNYLSQSIFCVIIFYGFGFGYFGRLERYQIYYVVAGVWLFQLVFSTIWLKYFLFGPFEWVWRSLTYWKKQPMRRVRVEKIPGPVLAQS